MVPSTIAVRVPADAPFRDLAAATAARFAELTGLPTAACAALEADVARAAEALARGADHLDVTCRHHAGGFEVTVASPRGTRVVTPRPA